MSWQFYKQDPKDTINNPIAGEFFSGEAVRDAATALVREALQNSLDARPQGASAPARVRIHLSEESGSLSAADAKRWFAGIWPHVHADGNGLADRPTQQDGCPFIVIEDFNTTGLKGDAEAYFSAPNVRNNFLSFFRAFGLSDKRAHSKGSWGIGKTVFPRSSRISSFYGYTVRASDARRMLLGRSILKFHEIGGQPYKSDGYFGTPRPSDGLIMPFEDSGLIDSFRAAFQLERNSEPGLSVVVPWYNTDGDNAITFHAVLRAVTSGFFFPILAGDLIFTLTTGSGRRIDLDAQTLPTVLGGIDENWARALLPKVELAIWWRGNRTPCVTLVPPPPGNAQKWQDGTIPADTLNTLLAKYVAQERFVVRVPMAIRGRNAEPKATWFDLVCESTTDDTSSTTFIRDGLIIPDVRPTKGTRGVQCLIVVEEDTLAAFLRDAENPAHTDWSPSTANFKDKYVWGPAGIEYVKCGLPELFAALRKGDTKPDLTITLDHFFLDRGHQKGGGGGGGGGKGPTPPPPPPPPRPPRRPRRFEIGPLAGGFSLRRPAPAPEKPPPPFKPFAVRIRTAYDVRSGTPIKHYDENDFDLADASFSIEAEGASVRTRKENVIVADITSEDFRISVKGFDTNRDVFVVAKAERDASDGD